MIRPLARIVVIENRTCYTIEIKEKRRAVPGHGETITVGPEKSKEERATKFDYTGTNPDRLESIDIFMDGRYTGRGLVPSDMIHNVKIIFETDDCDNLVVKAVRGTLYEYSDFNIWAIVRAFRDIRRLKGFGTFGGRDYEGRQEVII